MSRAVCLTGATGFVGRHVMAALADTRPLRAVVRPGQEGGLREGVTPIATPALFAETEEWWARALSGTDTLIHLAWIATPGEYLASPLNHHCLCGTLAMARGAARAGVRRVIGIGTCFEYAMIGRPLAVTVPLDPKTPYAGAKAAAFHALSGWFAGTDASFAWCRLFHLHGAGEDPRRLVPFLHARLSAGEPVEMTAGSQVRDFMDVAEAGRMIADVALGGMTGAVNICTGRPVTVRALAERIADGYGRRDLLRFGARLENLFDPPHVVGVPLQAEALP
ncbi:oxidoreductase [Defluviimonas sp. 20V17]|uniref:dTDP-6-deoxy-L-talose 4-dehydrogenase (NAD+) n=1 Tax=Allgaiera indica TaxID=765699 RepID=A0AAN4UQM3_9RHOB|nr:NAD(P)-dependent oxidoreductase [Allgaiera indica]KDB03136.1 oxidoreductase [Defluviimonas sp. 20V17]GHE00942.1 hypothetical protein GCM10008024_14590 [Allgaiera indica]SDW74900.1 dTDP-6-deoxy-L-talose 4-dehydrogenase (NAD+) [Allgaiera indica]